MSNPPHNQLLIDATGDYFMSSRLDLMLRNFTASYKLYWLRAVFDEAVAGNEVIPLKQLAARMVALAWHTITCYRLSLGASDQLTAAVTLAQQVCGLGNDASEKEVIDAVLTSDDKGLKTKLERLCRYVHCRLIRPFYADQLEASRKLFGMSTQRFDTQVDRLIIEYNGQDPKGAPYQFCSLDTTADAIAIDGAWARYFRENSQVVGGWLDMRLVDYLQRRNPSVPAIPLKIHPPQKRDLTCARSYWKEAIASHEFREIYTGLSFDVGHFDEFGPLSVDHFIPWSFVLHDEPWNLTPMFQRTNSSKNDKLPDLESFLKPLCAQQFDALITLRNRRRRHAKIYQAYLEVDPNIMAYERTDSSLVSFTESLTRILRPLHQIAANQGFPLWQGYDELPLSS